MPDQTEKKPSLRELAEGARRIHLVLLAKSINTTATAGSCMYGAFLLRLSLRQFGNCSEVIIRGGGGGRDGGYRDGAGVVHGHYWVETCTPEGRFVLDITADQFGADPVLVSPIAAARDRYLPGDQWLVDAHVEEFEASIMTNGADGMDQTAPALAV